MAGITTACLGTAVSLQPLHMASLDYLTSVVSGPSNLLHGSRCPPEQALQETQEKLQGFLMPFKIQQWHFCLIPLANLDSRAASTQGLSSRSLCFIVEGSPKASQVSPVHSARGSKDKTGHLVLTRLCQQSLPS